MSDWGWYGLFAICLSITGFAWWKVRNSFAWLIARLPKSKALADSNARAEEYFTAYLESRRELNDSLLRQATLTLHISQLQKADAAQQAELKKCERVINEQIAGHQATVARHDREMEHIRALFRTPGLVIKSARWVCTHHSEVSTDQTADVQGRVNQQDGSLSVLAHNSNFADACKTHFGYDAEGHPKRLEIEYFRFGKITVPYCNEVLIRCDCPHPVLTPHPELM